MKRVLIICPFTPSNKGAGVSYSKQFIENLSLNNYVDLFYYSYNGDPIFQPSKNVRILKIKRISTTTKLLGFISLPFLFPLFTARFNWKDYFFLKKRIKHIKYDFIYFDYSQTFSYALLIRHPNKILMSHDVIYQRYKREKSIFIPWIKISEKYLLKFGKVFTFSDKDVKIIKKQYHLNSYYTNFFLNNNISKIIPTNVENYFVFFAAWGRYDNDESLIWFIKNVYKTYNLTCSIKIIGGGLSFELKQLIRDLNIEYLGFVENPYPIISNAKALIAPLHFGAGVKVKCIETLACGTTVIGTDVALEGINEKYNNFMILANTPEDYYNAVMSVNNSLEEKICFKNFFSETYNDNAILKYLNQK